MDVIYNFYYNLHPRPRVTIMTEYRRVTDRQTDIPKADTHFTVPQGVEGWVDLAAGYIPRWFTRPQTDVVKSRIQSAKCLLQDLYNINSLSLAHKVVVENLLHVHLSSYETRILSLYLKQAAPHTGPMNGLRRSMQFGVQVREEIVIVCAGVRGDAGSTCQAVARISKCLSRHALARLVTQQLCLVCS